MTTEKSKEPENEELRIHNLFHKDIPIDLKLKNTACKYCSESSKSIEEQVMEKMEEERRSSNNKISKVYKTDLPSYYTDLKDDPILKRGIILTSQLVRDEIHQCLVCGQDGILQLCTKCRDNQLEFVKEKTLSDVFEKIEDLKMSENLLEHPQLSQEFKNKSGRTLIKLWNIALDQIKEKLKSELGKEKKL